MGQFYHIAGKRMLDLALATLGVVLAGPMMVMVGVVVWATSPGPVIFAQHRVGRRGQVFTLYKLRTMTVDPNRPAGQTPLDDPGVTPVGHWLRRYKIDELPQLWNVIRGDMSLVGPRPYVPEMQRQMPLWAKGRMEHRPGLTGLAQVSGNTALPWPRRWAFDAQYYPQIGRDVAILYRTIAVIIRGDPPIRPSQISPNCVADPHLSLWHRPCDRPTTGPAKHIG